MTAKVLRIESDAIEFDNGMVLSTHHPQDCCEAHWLCFDDLSIDDFKDLEFDLSGDSFFKKIDGYGIELVPVNGFSVKVPGYGSNNGYYSTDLTLVLSNGSSRKTWDITECQVITR